MGNRCIQYNGLFHNHRHINSRFIGPPCERGGNCSFVIADRQIEIYGGPGMEIACGIYPLPGGICLGLCRANGVINGFLFLAGCAVAVVEVAQNILRMSGGIKLF